MNAYTLFAFCEGGWRARAVQTADLSPKTGKLKLACDGCRRMNTKERPLREGLCERCFRKRAKEAGW